MNAMKMLIVFAMAAVFAFPVVHAATFAITPESRTVNVGDTFSVEVILDTQSQAIDGIDFRYLNFDPAILQVEDDNPDQAGIQAAGRTCGIMQRTCR